MSGWQKPKDFPKVVIIKDKIQNIAYLGNSCCVRVYKATQKRQF